MKKGSSSRKKERILIDLKTTRVQTSIDQLTSIDVSVATSSADYSIASCDFWVDLRYREGDEYHTYRDFVGTVQLDDDYDKNGKLVLISAKDSRKKLALVVASAWRSAVAGMLLGWTDTD